MKCNLQKKNKRINNENNSVSTKYSIWGNGDNQTQRDALNLDNYLFHAVGSYTGRENIVKRVKSILENKAILCEDFQSLVCDREIINSNNKSQSPKLNGKTKISICQKESYIEGEEVSNCFDLYIKSMISFVFSKELLNELNVYNEFEKESRWRWLDGEIRVDEKIPSEYFVAIAFPCEDHATRLQKMKNYGCQKEWIEKYFTTNFWQLALKEIEQYLEENDLHISTISIVTGKLMGNLEEEFKKAFSESEEGCEL